MLVAALPSGLSAAWADVRTFLAGVSFDRPSLLWLGFVPLLIALAAWFASRGKHSRIERIGRPQAVALLIGRARPQRLARFLASMAWACLVIGLAGPRWGSGEADGVAVGRDVVLVVDVSRSMLADDCAGGKARWQAAVAGCLDLLEAFKNRGGHRVAVIAFAARPVLLCPLTTDCEQARARLADGHGRFPPAAVRPDRDDFPSGTRIGAAISFAVESLDPRFLNYRDVILLSDGDDPAEDREWTAGVSAARKAGVPLHAVGLGDPDTASLIPLGNGLLEFAEGGNVPDPVRTRLHENVLKAMTTEGRGQYLPAHRSMPNLAAFVRTAVEPNPSRELSDDELPQKKLRSAWFYAMGTLFLLLSWRLKTGF